MRANSLADPALIHSMGSSGVGGRELAGRTAVQPACPRGTHTAQCGRSWIRIAASTRARTCAFVPSRANRSPATASSSASGTAASHGGPSRDHGVVATPAMTCPSRSMKGGDVGHPGCQARASTMPGGTRVIPAKNEATSPGGWLYSGAAS